MFGIDAKTITLIIFILVYLYLIVSKHHRGIAIWIGGIVLLITGILTFSNIVHFINWNVIGIFAGTLIVAELFIYSEVPVLLADFLISRSKTVGGALLWVCIMSSALSVFVENVATVLIIAPIALALSKKLNVSPVPFLIGIAVSSNLQGTATLIGDPPSMILAAYERMNFNDFFFYRGKPSIFFAVEVGAIASFFVLYLFFRPYRQKIEHMQKVPAKSWFPTYLLAGMIIALALSPIIDPEFRFAGGVVCMLTAIIGFIWYALSQKQGSLAILKKFDLDTTFFLAGVFVVVGVLEQVGVIEDLKNIIVTFTGGNRFANFIFLIIFSVLISAFIDNVPYVTTMIPVAQRLGADSGSDHYLLVFALLIGACLGGNITPIGASANIVSVGILRKNGYPTSFLTFLKIGLPFTIAATCAAAVFLWLVWR